MFWVFLIILIICATILLSMYIYYCAENEVGMFYNPTYDFNKRIAALEDEIIKLKRERE